jgi:murein DD-endopeptidase MepM/ murein hydrolase activator NlpD
MLFALPAAARAHTGTGGGGVAAPQRPVLEDVECVVDGTHTCGGGQLLKLRGEALSDVKLVIFRGAPGPADDETAVPQAASDHRVVVAVPATAPSGRVQVRSEAGVSRQGPLVEVTPSMGDAAPRAATGDGTFPIDGPFKFGESAANGFGGGRGHQGQDVFAECGTPIVAARAGTVQKAGTESAAGNYVVVKLDDGRSQVYMHMLAPAVVRKGQSVAVGQRLGSVGETGRATGCHLHFELWTAPGWYQGGRPVDPSAELRDLESGADGAPDVASMGGAAARQR